MHSANPTQFNIRCWTDEEGSNGKTSQLKTCDEESICQKSYTIHELAEVKIKQRWVSKFHLANTQFYILKSDYFLDQLKRSA